MSNPLWRTNDAFSGRSSYTTTVGGGRAVRSPGLENNASGLDGSYGLQAYPARQTDAMTHDDVIVRTFGLLALLVFTGVATWMFAPVLMFVGFPVAFVLGIIAGRRVAPGPGLCIAFTIFEGMGIGGLSGFFETAYKGIILQAVVATIAVFATVLVLYSFGVIRTSARATRFVVTATIGYMVFCVLNFGLVWFGVLPDFGIRSVTVFGVPLGLVISIVAVLLASYHLMRDFDYVQMGVAARAPRRLAWMCSLCLLATLVWLYLEFLRIFALLRN